MAEPKVRFKRDDGSSFPKWINCQFMSLIERIIDFRGRTPQKLGMEWVEGKTDYMALSALNVKSGYIDFFADPHYGDKRLYEKWMSGNELRKGQVLFTTEAPMGNVAQVPDDKPYILSQRTIAFNVIENKINEGYLSYLLLSPNVQTALSQLATGGTATGVSQKSLVKLFVTIPSSLDEQQKIADFLSSVDEVIAASEQEVANLETQKKTVMKKIFSQEVRFKREDGTDFPEWEEDVIGNMFQLTRGYVLAAPKTRKEQDTEYQYPVFSSQTKNDGRMGYYNEYLYEDAITWTTDGANAGTVRYREGRFYCTNVCGVLLKDKLKPNLCLAEILNIAATPWVTHNGNPKLMNNVMAEIRICYPSNLEEQRIIADFLSDFDEAISVAKKELELWKELKKGLLQQMFV